MTISLEDEESAWRLCELAWSAWLQSQNLIVFHTGEAVGNTPGSRAPLIGIHGARRRVPDLQTIAGGLSEYWEVKFRSRVDFDALTGERVHWISYDSFEDYTAISKATGSKVWIILYEAPTTTAPGRWLRADVCELEKKGRTGERFGSGGAVLRAWMWPAAAMEVVSGPDIDIDGRRVDLFPREGTAETAMPADPSPAGGEPEAVAASGNSFSLRHATSTDPVEDYSESDRLLALDILRRSLAIPVLPRYSVLRVGLEGIHLEELLSLLHYGIRVFLISEEGFRPQVETVELQAFRDSRLLEWAVIQNIPSSLDQRWVVDGALPTPMPHELRDALDRADAVGGINVKQFKIVHAPVDTDLLVTAGAGTGKTETMSERLIYLLATCGGTELQRENGLVRPFDLRADDVAFVTFTREAASQMRDRLGHTIMLRQRLCRRCVFPALAWLMQLASAEISTLHTFAKHLLQSAGGALGLSPGLRLSRHTLDLRRMFHDALSPHLGQMITDHSDRVPASYLWEDHFEAIWGALENNGVDTMPGADEAQVFSGLDWGGSESDRLHESVADATRTVIAGVAARYRALCLESQSVRLSGLIPLALEALRREDNPRVRRPRYLFVDEFQDTDALQMDFLLEIKRRLGSKLFVVGDAKQGIYRFRGAEGNAFQELKHRVESRGLDEFADYSLVRNFRSGARLLNSIHPYFHGWGLSELLVYSDADRLRPVTWQQDTSTGIEFSRVSKRRFATAAAEEVAGWREASPKATIAILCRQNWQAIEVKTEIEKAGGHCELLVGGSFFTSPAVRELEVFLRSVADPDDDAALLQVCETRWAAGLLAGNAPRGAGGAEWQTPVPPLLAWQDRFGSLDPSGSYAESDLGQLRLRLLSLARLLNKMPVIAWIVECSRVFVPESTELPSDSDDFERRRYARCFNHLITLLDSNFEEGPLSLQKLLTWIQIQIATNKTEDEPIDAGEFKGRSVALTVHKAKGLEFDNVLIPNSWTPFESARKSGTRVAVLRQVTDLPRLVWEWKGTFGAFSNVAQEEQDLWQRNSHETAREEARLLYVALTRAKQRVRVYVPFQGRPAANPSSWADLLNYGR